MKSLDEELTAKSAIRWFLVLSACADYHSDDMRTIKATECAANWFFKQNISSVSFKLLEQSISARARKIGSRDDTLLEPLRKVVHVCKQSGKFASAQYYQEWIARIMDTHPDAGDGQ